MNVYLAGSIFYYGDVLRNREWAAKIRAALPGINLYSPIENTDINGAEGKKKCAGSQAIVDGDNARLDGTDVLIACIDGDVLPVGTSAEIGYMAARCRFLHSKQMIIGICTDNRQCFLTHSAEKDAAGAAEIGEQQYSYQNLYVTGLIKKYGHLVTTIDEAIVELKRFYNTTHAETDTWQQSSYGYASSMAPSGLRATAVREGCIVETEEGTVCADWWVEANPNKPQ